jgi:hypothetical protein
VTRVVYVLEHIHGMDYLASRPGRDFSTDSSIDHALRFDNRNDAVAAEQITPGIWTIKETVIEVSCSQSAITE